MLLRALRWRAAASLATVLLAALTVLGVVVGPLWTQAGSESLLRDTLTSAAPVANAALGEAQGVPSTEALASLDRAMSAVPLPRHLPPIRGLKLLTDVGGVGGQPRFRAPMLARDDLCAHVTVVSGRCPTQAGEVLLHRQLVALLRPGVSRVGVSVQAERGSTFRLATTQTVVGSYVPNDPAAPYWAGEEAAFLASAATTDGGADRVPAVLTVPGTFDAIARQYVGADRPIGFATSTQLLDTPRVRRSDLAGIRAAVSRSQQSVSLGTSAALDLAVRDGVADQLDLADREAESLGLASTVVLAQLVLLAGAVLVLVVGGSAAARAPEVAAVRLRGLRTRSVLGLALVEPLLLVALGAPLGSLLGWLLVKALAAAKLVEGTPVGVPASALQAVVLAVTVLVGTVVVVCARVLGKPVLELWQRTAPPVSRTAAVRDLTLVAMGSTLAVSLARSGEPWVLLAPVPVSLVVALIGLRALPLLLRPALRRTRGRRSVSSFLALRQLVRRREGAQLTALLVVAFGLAVTATAAWSVTGQAAASRSAVEVGATRVLIVQPPPEDARFDLRAAVRRADPGGREAMAVLEYLPFENEPGGRLLAVDSTRLAAVATWDAEVVGATVEAVVDALQVPAGNVASAVVTSTVQSDPESTLAPGVPDGGALVTGVDGKPRVLAVRAVVPALPRALGRGSIVDLDAFTDVDPTQVAALSEVWTTSSNPALVTRLEAQGLTVLRIEDTGARRDLLARQGPGLAVLLSLTAAALGLLLAAATTLIAVLTGARRRGFELAALGALGVPASVLRRSSRAETLLLLGSGLLLGAVAGAVACWLVLSSLPLFSDDGNGLALPVRVEALPLVLLGSAGLLLAGVTAAAIGRVLQRAADPARLREVQA